MKKAYKLNLNPKMESKDQFHKHFEKTFDAIYDAIDVPLASLFQVIERVKSFKFAIDSKLVQIVSNHRQSRWLERFGAAQSGMFKRFTDHPSVVKLSATALVDCREFEFITIRVLRFRLGTARQNQVR